MKSEKRAQKFHTDDTSLTRSASDASDWLNQIFSRGTTNLGSDAPSVWNFWALFSDVIWQGNQWAREHRQMSAVFLGYVRKNIERKQTCFFFYILSITLPAVRTSLLF